VSEKVAVAAEANAGRATRDLVRYAIGIAVGIIVLVLLVGRRGELSAALGQLGQVRPGWLACAIGAEAMSLWSFGYLQHRVLRLAGTRVAVGALFALSVASDAIALTVPGEPVVSSAYRFRYYRRRGATAEGAGWTIFTILLAQAVAMASLVLLGVVVALAGRARGTRGAAVVGLVLVLGAGAILVRRDLVLRIAEGVTRLARRLARRPRTAGAAEAGIGARVEAALARMREIPLPTRSAVLVVAIAAFVWLGDFGCLLASLAAVRARIPWSGVLLAFGIAQIVGSLPVVPGGLGVVEGSLAVILAAYGMGRVQALSAVLVFRGVGYWLAIVVGWITVGMIARLARRSRRAGSPALAVDPHAVALLPPE
jgi:uncharacterized protein (TIRG00374 family)